MWGGFRNKFEGNRSLYVGHRSLRNLLAIQGQMSCRQLDMDGDVEV